MCRLDTHSTLFYGVIPFYCVNRFKIYTLIEQSTARHLINFTPILLHILTCEPRLSLMRIQLYTCTYWTHVYQIHRMLLKNAKVTTGVRVLAKAMRRSASKQKPNYPKRMCLWYTKQMIRRCVGISVNRLCRCFYCSRISHPLRSDSLLHFVIWSNLVGENTPKTERHTNFYDSFVLHPRIVMMETRARPFKVSVIAHTEALSTDRYTSNHFGPRTVICISKQQRA